MKFQRYDRYKDSGFDWLGEIPEEWKSYRINWINTIIRGNTSFKKDELLDNGEYVALQYGKIYQIDEVNKTFKFYVNSEFYKSDQAVGYGNTILVSTSETIEDLGHSCFYNRSDIGLIGGEQILLKPNNKYIFEKYLYYYSKVFCNELGRYATGLKVFRFNIDDLKNIFISLPSIVVQKQIATYLDTKTSIIDTKISILEQKKDRYKELKQTLINEVVTKGLDEAVSIKDSNINWIGKVPIHWKIQRIGTAFQERSTKVNDTDFPPLSVTKNGIVPQLKNVAKTIHNDNRKLVLSGDYVINSRSDRRGSSGIAEIDGSVSVINIVLSPKEEFHGKYLHHLFRSYSFIEEFYRNGQGIIYDLWTTKYSLMRTIHFAFPKIEEQIEIANYLDDKTEKIDDIIKTIDKSIQTFKEFRKTLINDAVTGKIKIA